VPLYVTKHANLVVGDVAFATNGARAEDQDAAVAAVRALYAPDADPGADVTYGASYDERLADVDSGGDLVVIETAAEKAAAAAKKTTK
jgi:phosphate-selective porin